MRIHPADASLLVTVGGLFAVPYAHNLWHLLAILGLFAFGSGPGSEELVGFRPICDDPTVAWFVPEGARWTGEMLRR